MRPVPAVSTAAFDGHPLEAALDAIATLGAGRVEPAYIRGYTAFDEDDLSEPAAARLAGLLADRGLGAQAVSAHMDLSRPGAAAMLARRIRFAASLGAPILVTNAGPAAARETILARLDGARAALEETGVTLALENPGHGAGDLIGRAGDGAALVEAVGDPLVRLNLDLGNLVTYAGGAALDLVALARALPLAAHAHLKDVAEEGPHWRFVPLGGGLVDWLAVRRLIDRHAPSLPLAVELPLRLSRPRRGDPVRASVPPPFPAIVEALRRSLTAWAAAC